ncbi:hypothetical protein ACIGHB_28805 [Streptomyces sp. NPDC085460]|uniref:hypothetical protein n=1 Tax=Streptomyces sp. NPDC085460 TaxID=3365723 RepID=UPI0037D47C70
MSWNVFVMRCPPEVDAIDQMAADWEPPSLGTGRDVRAVLAEVLPGIEYSTSGWADWESAGFSLSTLVDEVDDAPVAGVSLIVHGHDATAAQAVLAIADALNARALDIGSGDFLTKDSARFSFASWRAYRDRILDLGRPSFPSRDSFG